jgi:uncharacterized protein (DUF1015 family)
MAAARLEEPAAGADDAGSPREVAPAAAIVRFRPVPAIRSFRALRYAPDRVADLATVVAPPYDVISPEAHLRLLAADPRNVVRLDLPEEQAGDPPDERYRRAAKLLTTWRTDGTLHRDPRPAIYPYEQTYTIPGTDRVATRRGIFARVGLEPFGPTSGIRAHERTLAAPREDRYRLRRATGVNTSPVVGIGGDSSGTVAGWLREVAATAPVSDLTDGDGVRHRLWVMPPGEDAPGIAAAAAIEHLSAQPITLADGTTATKRRCGTRRSGAPGRCSRRRPPGRTS